jgi:hypothetical protein
VIFASLAAGFLRLLGIIFIFDGLMTEDSQTIVREFDLLIQSD